MAAETPFYVGAGMGLGSYSINKNKLDNNLEDLTGGTVTGKADDNANNWTIYAGWRFMENFAVEAAYLDLNGAEYRGNVTDANGTGRVKLDWSAQGFPITALGIWPINETWEVFGRVGVFIGDVDGDGFAYIDGVQNAKVSESATSTQFIGGVGVDANFMENFAVRFEWMAMPSIGDDDVGGSANWNQLALSLLWRF